MANARCCQSLSNKKFKNPCSQLEFRPVYVETPTLRVSV